MDESTQDVSGMRRFCADCKYLKFDFLTFYDQDALEKGDSMLGTLEGICFKPLCDRPMTPAGAVPAALNYIDRGRVEDGICGFLFTLDDVPRSLRSQVTAYVDSQDCPIDPNKAHCALYIERLMKDVPRPAIAKEI